MKEKLIDNGRILLSPDLQQRIAECHELETAAFQVLNHIVK